MRDRRYFRRLLGGLAATLVAATLACVLAAPAPSLPDAATDGSANAAQTARPADPAPDQDESPEYDPRSVVALFDDDATVEEVNAALADRPGLTSSVVDGADIERGFVKLDLLEGVSVDSAIVGLREAGGIGQAQPNFHYSLLDGDADLAAGLLATLATTINDARIAEQWYLDAEHGVNAYDAWDLSKTEQGVTVAVLDSGCKFTHADLEDNFVEAYDATSVTGRNSGTGDINGHGTHVCGIIAATANNGKGVAGVSYNAKFIPIQVFFKSGDSMGADTSELLAAFSYIEKNAAEKNIRVVNMSLGGKISAASDDAVIAAIEQAYDNGILTVCAAGNADYPRPYTIYPGDYLKDGHGLNVVAVDKNHERPDYSNYNVPGKKTKDISAPGGLNSDPGVGLLSTVASGADRYGFNHGTSMAAPVVSGVASLVFAANPELTPGQVIDIIHSTATDLGKAGWDETYGYGLVNAFEAVKCAKAELVGTGALAVGAQASLAASPAASGTWEWSSSDGGIATVTDGTVTGIAPGQVTITARRGSFAISKDIVVHATSISGSASISTGKSAGLSLSTDIAGGTWTWSSSDERVATVSGTATGATVTGVASGNATITAYLTSDPSIKATYDISVEPADEPKRPDKPETQPVEPSSPEKKPDESEKVEQPDEPEQSEQPSEPEQPQQPEQPEQPQQPSEPEQPEQPQQPQQPGQSGQPEQSDVSNQLEQKPIVTEQPPAIEKSSQKITVKTKAATVAKASIKSRSRTVHCIKGVPGHKTQLVYAKKSGSKKLSIDKRTGLVTVKKKAKRGTHKMVVSVYAKEGANYLKSNTVTKTLKVKVK